MCLCFECIMLLVLFYKFNPFLVESTVFAIIAIRPARAYLLLQNSMNNLIISSTLINSSMLNQTFLFYLTFYLPI